MIVLKADRFASFPPPGRAENVYALLSLDELVM